MQLVWKHVDVMHHGPEHFEGWLALAGVLSVLAGLFLIFRTGEGALALIWLIAGFAFVFGIILILLALKAKSWVSDLVSR